jgi:hypothetical protein
MLKNYERVLMKINLYLSFSVASFTILFMFLFGSTDQALSKEKKGLLGMSLPASYRPFSDDSPWNTLIGKSPRISKNSNMMIRHLNQKAGYLKGDMTEWTVPMFVINAKQSPLHSVHSQDLEPLHPSVDPQGTGAVNNLPIPDGVWPDPQSDGHMLLVDIKKQMSWDFSRAELLPNGKWQASRVGIWDLNSSGYAPAFEGKYWWTIGARGGGMPLIAGLIRPEEIEAGEIRHALLCATPINRKALVAGNSQELCNPTAARTDGQLYGSDTIPMGARLQLDPSLDLDALSISPQTKIVARAMQRYGLYVGDSSVRFKIYFQNLGPKKGRWRQISEFTDLRNIPVEKFRVLDCQIATRSNE